MDEKQKITYTETEQVVLENADRMFEVLNQLIAQAKNTCEHAWNIKVLHNKDAQNESPYKQLIDMFNYYIKQAENSYGEYCQKNNIVSVENAIKTLDKNEKESIQLKPLKQVYNIK